MWNIRMNKNSWGKYFFLNGNPIKARTVVGVRYLHEMAVMKHQIMQGAVKP